MQKETIINNIQKALERNSKGSTRILFNKKTEELKTFLIPIENLFFNPQNARLGSFTKFDKSIEKSDIYNEVVQNKIENWIWNEWEQKNLQDVETLKEFGLIRPLIITKDGRVLGGNRRLTMMKYINNKDLSLFQTVECAVITKDLTKKQIDDYELALQYNEPDKVDYDVVALMIKAHDLYLRMINIEKVTKNEAILEISNKFNKPKQYIEKMIHEYELTNTFLLYIGQKENFELFKKMQLNKKMNDLVAKTYKKSNTNFNDELKNIFKLLRFNLFVIAPFISYQEENNSLKRILSAPNSLKLIEDLKVYIDNKYGEDLKEFKGIYKSINPKELNETPWKNEVFFIRLQKMSEDIYKEIQRVELLVGSGNINDMDDVQKSFKTIYKKIKNIPPAKVILEQESLRNHIKKIIEILDHINENN